MTEMMPDVSSLFIAGFIVFAGQIVYAALGFGSGLISVSIWALLYGDIRLFVPAFLLLCLPTEVFVTIKDFKKISFKESSIFLIFIIPALVLATWWLKFASEPWMLIILGLIIITVSVYYFFFENNDTIHFKPNNILVAIFGFLSGVLGGLFTMSGPPLVFYFKGIGFSKSQFRASLMGIFCVMSFVRFITYASFGFFTNQVLMSAAWLMPFSLAGLIAGLLIHSKLNESLFQKITSLLLLMTGFLLIIKNV